MPTTDSLDGRLAPGGPSERMRALRRLPEGPDSIAALLAAAAAATGVDAPACEALLAPRTRWSAPPPSRRSPRWEAP